MAMKPKFKFVLLIILLVHVSWIAWASSPGQILLKIAPAGLHELETIAAAGATVVQELRSCLLVSAPPQAVARLQAVGVSSLHVATPLAGESIFLLHSQLPSPLAALVGTIDCRLLEANVWLLRTTNPDFRDWLVQPFRLKALRFSEKASGPGVIPARKSRIAERVADFIPSRGSDLSDLVARVSLERLRADILALQNFQTRYTTTPQCWAAGDFILERFSQLGLSAEADPFVFEGVHESRNIVSVIPGMRNPEKIVLACAHYDSTSRNPFVWAPGADDNASGTAAILELARILAEEKFDFSIVLLCVSAEEQGLYGSDHYARQARSDGDEIIAVVNLDMIAYPGSKQRELDVIANRQSEWLADRFIAVAQPHVALHLDKVVDASLTWSDHSSFWDQGFAALCGIEDSDNPNYHRDSDTLETLDLFFATEVVQASLAAVAEMAQLESNSAAAVPTGLKAQSQISWSLYHHIKTTYLSWQANLEPIAGYHVYRAEQSHGLYQRLTSQPITVTNFKDPFLDPDRTYFYVLTAVDDQGRQSNFSREVRDNENN